MTDSNCQLPDPVAQYRAEKLARAARLEAKWAEAKQEFRAYDEANRPLTADHILKEKQTKCARPSCRRKAQLGTRWCKPCSSLQFSYKMRHPVAGIVERVYRGARPGPPRRCDEKPLCKCGKVVKEDGRCAACFVEWIRTHPRRCVVEGCGRYHKGPGTKCPRCKYAARAAGKFRCPKHGIKAMVLKGLRCRKCLTEDKPPRPARCGHGIEYARGVCEKCWTKAYRQSPRCKQRKRLDRRAKQVRITALHQAALSTSL